MKVNVLFILDSSGSMWAHLNGQPKMDSARRVLTEVLTDLPENADLGLMAYGHRRRHDCKDIEVLAPIGTKNAEDIKAIAGALKPKGMTPLADSLTTAAAGLRAVRGAKMVVLITDGGEQCGGDPCAVTRAIAATGLVVRVNVVGFVVSDKERTELQCIAKEGSGRYFDVTDKESLYQAIGSIRKEVAVLAAPPPSSPAGSAPPLPEPLVVPPPPGRITHAGDIDVLAASEGGTIVAAPNGRWATIIAGTTHTGMGAFTGQEVVLGFRDGRAARFSRVMVAVPYEGDYNLKEFELAISAFATGPFSSIGTFTVRNKTSVTIYQAFTFSEVTARYIKVKVISNYGHPIEDWGNTQLYRIRLMGSLV
jgi:hypothetical protein